jgi:hypothetical protein
MPMCKRINAPLLGDVGKPFEGNRHFATTGTPQIRRFDECRFDKGRHGISWPLWRVGEALAALWLWQRKRGPS